jgi:peptide/nickel transport system ATP-binding protein
MEPRAEGDQRRRTQAIAPRVQLPDACPYAHRCPNAQAHCDATRPALRALAEGHLVACHFPQAGAEAGSGRGAAAAPAA